MSLLKKAELSIAGSSDTFLLEHRVFNLSCFIIIIFCLQGMIINYAIGLNIVTVWLSFLGLMVSITIFYLSRYKYWFTPVTILTYTFATMVVLGAMHFYNGGSYGPIIYLFIMLLNIFLLISQRTYQLIIYGLLSGTVLLLLLMEHYYPRLVVPYDSVSERLIDHTTAILYSMFFTMLVIRTFKNSYDKDRILIISQKDELQEAYAASMKKNQYIESLIKEIHHRVNNNLQVISSMLLLQSNRVNDEKIRDVLEESRGRIAAIALVHQKLYMHNELAKVNISEYLHSLCETIATTSAYEARHVRTEVTLADPLLNIDLAILMGLMVNELVSNSFKHAFIDCPSPMINISLSSDSNGIMTLRVSDNGRGMPDSDAKQNPASFGLRLLDILVKQLNGRLDIIQDNGTHILIQLQRKNE